jgi:hypothetical protein
MYSSLTPTPLSLFGSAYPLVSLSHACYATLGIGRQVTVTAHRPFVARRIDTGDTLATEVGRKQPKQKQTAGNPGRVGLSTPAAHFHRSLTHTPLNRFSSRGCHPSIPTTRATTPHRSLKTA